MTNEGKFLIWKKKNANMFEDPTVLLRQKLDIFT